MARDTDITKPVRQRLHTVSMENRERAVFTGVTDVDSFNDQEILLMTDAGGISLNGEDLHIAKLNLDEGQLIVEGYIHALDYIDEGPQKRGGLFSKLFK